MNVSVEGSAERVDRAEAAAVVSGAPPRGTAQPVPAAGECPPARTHTHTHARAHTHTRCNECLLFAADKWHFLSNL